VNRKQERQKRYRHLGAAAGLVKVETLVPPEGRDQVLTLAAELRERYRHRAPDPTDVDAIVGRVRRACARLPRRYAPRPDVDAIVVTSVNVPFGRTIDAETLADGIRRDQVPAEYAGHFGRFLCELPIAEVLRFGDRHGIDAPVLAKFVRHRREQLGLRRPELDEHLDALVPGS
jgi:hypothetical protein